ncbi:MAG TPA: hypothetical protein VN660_01755 [Steroidobacteraceae bacterium]|nr:hypothetical protein [Steroidobacteraceae bacterium]
MAQSEELRAALHHTYAGHVFNAVHAAFSMDLVRAVGSLILDTRRGTASVARAVMLLKRPDVVSQLRAQEYEPRPASSRDEEMQEAIKQLQAREFDSVFSALPGHLERISTTVLDAPTARLIEDIRNKAVAHSAIEHDGGEFRIWPAESAGLTYQQLDDYIDLCTQAVDRLSHVVLRTAFAFDDVPKVQQRYADDYIEALVIGLNHQRQERERKRQENLRQMRRT